MNANSIIFQMPFDESDGSAVAFDYSQNRADGAVVGAKFVAGRMEMQFPLVVRTLARFQRRCFPI